MVWYERSAPDDWLGQSEGSQKCDVRLRAPDQTEAETLSLRRISWQLPSSLLPCTTKLEGITYIIGQSVIRKRWVYLRPFQEIPKVKFFFRIRLSPYLCVCFPHFVDICTNGAKAMVGKTVGASAQITAGTQN